MKYRSISRFRERNRTLSSLIVKEFDKAEEYYSYENGSVSKTKSFRTEPVSGYFQHHELGLIIFIEETKDPFFIIKEQKFYFSEIEYIGYQLGPQNRTLAFVSKGKEYYYTYKDLWINETSKVEDASELPDDDKGDVLKYVYNQYTSKKEKLEELEKAKQKEFNIKEILFSIVVFGALSFYGFYLIAYCYNHPDYLQEELFPIEASSENRIRLMIDFLGVNNFLLVALWVCLELFYMFFLHGCFRLRAYLKKKKKFDAGEVDNMIEDTKWFHYSTIAFVWAIVVAVVVYTLYFCYSIFRLFKNG